MVDLGRRRPKREQGSKHFFLRLLVAGISAPFSGTGLAKVKMLENETLTELWVPLNLNRATRSGCRMLPAITYFTI